MMVNKTYRMLWIIISFGIVFFLWFGTAGQLYENPVGKVVINEVCNNNFSTVPLLRHEDDDWIEIYNGTGEKINLEGWTISDNERKLQKYSLPEIVLEDEEYLLLYANGEDTVTKKGIFLNFKLSDGENVYLCDSTGHLVDSVSVPELKENTSYARMPDGGENWLEVYPSLQTSNNDSEVVREKEVPAPVFSMEGGFYSGMSLLELFTEDEDTYIYYTLDGSIPTEESMWYMEPIPIENRGGEENNLSAKTGLSKSKWYQYVPEDLVDKITVVRAIAIDSEGNRSKVVTNSYIVDLQDDPAYQNLATVSLTTDPNYFFDEEDGLYLLGAEYERQLEQAGGDAESVEVNPNYMQSGKGSERDASIEIYDADKKLLLKQNVGIRIHGNSTRDMSQKSFSVYARSMYDGKDNFDTDVFGGDNTYHKFVLLTDHDETKIRQELHAKLLDERAVDTKKYKRCNVFLNGEYWGVYWIAEVYDEEYIQNYYNIPKDEVIVESGLWEAELCELAENKDGLTDEELYASMAEKIDLESCIDYYASMIYIDHHDWFSQNGYMWKSATISEDNPYQDGKWRWMVHDTERSEEEYFTDTFHDGVTTSWEDDPIINTLMLSDEFRERFVTTFMDMANTTFKTENVFASIDSIFGDYSRAVDAQAMRWGDDWAGDMDEKVDEIKFFYENRFGYITEFLKKEFSVSGELVPVEIEISESAKGDVVVNTAHPEWESNAWTGYYFTDYPITLTAEEKEGASFTGWYDQNKTLISEEHTITVSLESQNYYMARFE